VKRAADKTLDVFWHDGRLVAQMAHCGPLFFRYDRQWLESGHDLSPLCLPFDEAPKNLHDLPDGVPGLIGDCLPDAWGRRVAEAVFAKHGFGRPTPMKLLGWVGARGLGALSFRPPVMRSPLMLEISAASLAREARSIIEGSIDEVLVGLEAGGSAGGAYPKTLVVLRPDGSLRTGGSIEHLNEADVPCLLKLHVVGALGHNAEFAYMRMAEAAGIATMPSRLLVDEEGRSHLLVERFDVDPQGKRNHVHSLAGLLHAPKDGLDYAKLMQATTRLGCPCSDLLEVARRLVFNLLAVNQDDHAKNHAFLYREEGRQWELAPAFDLTFSEGIIRGMKIAGEDVPEKARLTAWLESSGLSREALDGVFESVRSAIDSWRHFADDAGVREDQRDRISGAHARIARMVFGEKRGVKV
jgi:serine/threonine-protein kinase HipA